MIKQFLYIVDPLPSLNVTSDTTLALMQEAGQRGVKNFACELGDVFLKDGRLYFMAAPVALEPSYSSPPAYLAPKTPRSADEFNVIFMRKDPPVDELFWAALFMLRCYDPNKTVMINEPDGILVGNEKLFGQKVAKEFFPPTLVTADPKLVRDFIEEHKKIVLKPLFKAGGAGVLVFEQHDRNLMSALDLLTNGFSAPVMVQEYIKNAREGDKRIIVVGGRALGAITRIPQELDHRSNFHAGGSAKAAVLEARDQEIVSALKPYLMDFGLHLVGIDVIGGYLTEINVTSPTCVIEIEHMQKPHELKLRAQILDYIEGLIA